MSRASTAQATLGLSIVVLFLLPFLVIGFQIRSWVLPDLAEVAPVFAFTFWQAFLSAFLSLVVGLPSASGLMWLARRQGEGAARAAEAFVLLPNTAPVILLLLAVMKLFPWLTGLAGIVVVHTLLNAGLVAVSFLSLSRIKLSGLAELAWVEGASRVRFFRWGVWPALKRDLALLFLFVFALCFSSFAVPLVIGGSRATTIEVLIYQKIRLSADWSEALGLAALQMTTVLVLAWCLRRGQDAGLSLRSAPIALLSSKWGLVFAALPGAILVYGLLQGLGSGIEQLSRLGSLLEDLPSLVAGSFVLSMMTASLVVSFLLVLAYLHPQGWLRRFIMGYAAPSSVLTGIALLVFWRQLGWATYLKIAFGLSLVCVPAFYRLQWDSLLRSLANQRMVAKTLGAGDGLIFRRIVFPQVIRQACLLGGIASLWAWGDFALSSVVAERAMTVAMVTEGLMGSYRLDAATVLSWLLIGCGVLNFLFLVGAGRVLGEKPQP